MKFSTVILLALSQVNAQGAEDVVPITVPSVSAAEIQQTSVALAPVQTSAAVNVREPVASNNPTQDEGQRPVPRVTSAQANQQVTSAQGQQDASVGVNPQVTGAAAVSIVNPAILPSRTGNLPAASIAAVTEPIAQVSGTVADQAQQTSAAAVSANSSPVALASLSPDQESKIAVAASVVQGGDTALAKATNAPVGLDSSALPNGISEVKQAPTSDFCRQFVNQGMLETNGSQFRTGLQGCSSTELGLLPDVNNMVSTLIVEPAYDATLNAQLNNTVVIHTNNLEAGFFSDPNKNYYLTPSTLNAQKNVQGHQHITVQAIDVGQVTPPDPKKFLFFKGINDKEVDPLNQVLRAVIPAKQFTVDGTYRICSLTGSNGHQPILSPVQRRGAQDDCIRVKVSNTGAAGQTSAGQKNVADDSAENTQVTVNGTNTGVKASNDNSGTDAGNGNITKKVDDVNANIKAGITLPGAGNLNQGGNTGAGNVNQGGNTGAGNANQGGNTGVINQGGNTGAVNQGGNTGAGNVNQGGNTGAVNQGGNTGAGNVNQGGNTGAGNANQGGNTGAGNVNQGDRSAQVLSQLKVIVNQMLTLLAPF